MTSEWQFKKGQSGNTNGRPKGAKNKLTLELADIAQEYTLEALNVLVEVMRNKKTTPKVRIVAAAHILDRGWGKPVAFLQRESQAEVTHIDGGYKTIENEDE
jgi:hypothetical protein